jgi:tetratricopeptide (TPR) repeat protein
MKLRNIYILLAALFLAACGGPKNLTKYKESAKSAVAAGNYSVAVESWKNYFEQQAATAEGITGEEYAEAAKTAYKAGMNEQATDWFDQARYKNYADEDMYLTLADIFREQDNLSKELSALEYYRENFSKTNAIVNSRLFSIYDEIDMTEKALTIWENLPESKKSTKENLEKYFEINKELENEAVVDSMSLELLEVNPEHTEALEWNAMKYYWKAENLYKREMQKYETNKTRSQYRKLLEQLDVVTANFKKSLTYFEKLWEQNPGEKYAPYMANIHARFNDEQKARYYRKFVE